MNAATSITIYHVTDLRNGGAYGHSTAHCNEVGCAGDEQYLGTPAEHVERGGLYDIETWEECK